MGNTAQRSHNQTKHSTMKTNATKTTTLVLAYGLAFVVLSGTLRADTFGSGTNTFTIDFVPVGNAGNADDAGAGGGIYSSPYGGVAYPYWMGVYEISQDQITKAAASTPALANVTVGPWTGSRPAANITWYECAAFVNWLNTSTGHQAAYNLTYSGGWSMSPWSSGDAWQLGGENLFRHKDAYYFLPSEDEWYKAAYHKNDGVTANYWDYPTGSNSIPDGVDFSGDTAFDAVCYDGYDTTGPYAVTNAGSAASAYGTYGQGGNVWEWFESAWDGLNDSPSEDRGRRGSFWYDSPSGLRCSFKIAATPTYQFDNLGFRVARVPEPGSITLLLAGSLGLTGVALHRRRRVTKG
jgi:formylglycine-generating enzyme